MPDRPDIKVTIVDYGMGNLRSVYNKLQPLATRVVLSSSPADILDADRIILPGVGHFAQGMRNLEESGLRDALEKQVIGNDKPILGICLGMQLLTEHSEEGDAPGLGWVKGSTVRFDASKVSNPHFKVPHMGWNTLSDMQGMDIYSGVSEQDEFYFCHTYHVISDEVSQVAATCSYGYRFVASVKRGNIIGAQFHPEKSHDAGARLMSNFIKSESHAAIRA